MFSLNLLPQDEKRELRYEKLFLISKYSAGLLVSFMVLASWVLYFSKFALEQSYQEYQKSRATVSFEGDQLTQEISAFNKKLTQIEGIQKEYAPWVQVLEQVARAIPQGVSLSAITIDRGNKLVSVSGIARDRAVLAQLKTTLESVPDFSELQTPRTAIVERGDIPFTLTGKFMAAKKSARQ